VACVRFTGDYYHGFDGDTPVRLTTPGDYPVSAAKATQLTTDFPSELARLPETPAKGSGDEAKTKQVETDQHPAKKGP